MDVGICMQDGEKEGKGKYLDLVGSSWIGMNLRGYRQSRLCIIMESSFTTGVACVVGIRAKYGLSTQRLSNRAGLFYPTNMVIQI